MKKYILALAIMTMGFFSMPQATQAAALVTYRNPSIGVSFAYPSGWVATYSSPLRYLDIEPRTASSAYAISVQVLNARTLDFSADRIKTLNASLKKGWPTFISSFIVNYKKVYGTATYPGNTVSAVVSKPFTMANKKYKAQILTFTRKTFGVNIKQTIILVTSGNGIVYQFTGSLYTDYNKDTKNTLQAVLPALVKNVTLSTGLFPPLISSAALTPNANGTMQFSWRSDRSKSFGLVKFWQNGGVHEATYSGNSSVDPLGRSVTISTIAGKVYNYQIWECLPTTNMVNPSTAYCTVLGTYNFTAQYGVDPNAPVGLSAISANYLNGMITVSWSVTPNADGIVNWGPDVNYGQHLSDFNFTGSHSISFAASLGQTVHYAIRSCTQASVCYSSGDLTYTTPSS